MSRKVDNLEIFRNLRKKNCIYINISCFFYVRHSVLVAWGNEISVGKVLMSIKVVPGKNNYFLHQKFEMKHFLKYFFW